MCILKGKRMKKRIVLFLFLSFFFASAVFAEQLTAETIAPMNVPHDTAGVVSYNGELYVWGGYTWPNGWTNILEVYNPRSDSWTMKSNFPALRNGMGNFVLNGNIYSIGGEGPYPGAFTNSVYLYEVTSDTWFQLNGFPVNTWTPITTVCNGVAYVIGGRHGYGATYSHVYAYNEGEDSWIPKANMPYSVIHSGVIAREGTIWVFGGNHKTSEAANEFTNIVQIYDTTTNSWSFGADIPFYTTWPKAVFYNGKAWFFPVVTFTSSAGTDSIPCNEAYSFDFDTNQWDIYEHDIRSLPFRSYTVSDLGLIDNCVYFTQIYSLSSDERLVNAFKVALPSNPIRRILKFIDDSVADGTLYPVKSGKPGQGQLGAFKNMIEAAGNLIDAELFDQACEQLQDALEKTDGIEPPDSAPDFLAGPTATELADMIIDLMQALGCQ
jgi:N-acetylneuraminic acid mutarotase